ncbi:hypothetical protein ACIQXM_01910 [Arthrobacter sp. NPDC097144]|uniref:hypothetical protein n=1 Tax=Arthrobacter sp. NPDC097144 TaxID=3363946 RepID=UPI0037FBE346
MSNDSNTTQRDELALDIFLADNSSIPEGELHQDWTDAPDQHRPYAQSIADGLLGKGYRKQVILGYVVVGRDGGMVTGSSYSTHTEAQAKADEWTVGAKTNQVDWEYRVAEIVEATR